MRAVSQSRMLKTVYDPLLRVSRVLGVLRSPSSGRAAPALGGGKMLFTGSGWRCASWNSHEQGKQRRATVSSRLAQVTRTLKGSEWPRTGTQEQLDHIGSGTGQPVSQTVSPSYDDAHLSSLHLPKHLLHPLDVCCKLPFSASM